MKKHYSLYKEEKNEFMHIADVYDKEIAELVAKLLNEYFLNKYKNSC